MRARSSTLLFVLSLGIAACGGSNPSGPSASATALKVTNQLLIPIQVSVNGQSVGQVPATTVKEIDLGVIDTLKMEWDMVCATMPDGEPIGYKGGGVFSAIRTSGGTKSVTIDNQIGSSTYFSPAITNTSSDGLKMAVNEGMAAEIQCPLEIAPGAQDVALGYYRLYSTSSVRGYKAASNYSGPSVNWAYGADFTISSLEDGSGRLPLTCTRVSAMVDRDHAGTIAPRTSSHDDLTEETSR